MIQTAAFENTCYLTGWYEEKKRYGKERKGIEIG